MEDFELISDYKDDNELRFCFHKLTDLVFGFNLEKWYQHSFWGNRYIPYSFIKNDQILANVSINKMDLIINGKAKNAIQIGTVMTHPDFRKKGLAAKLLKIVHDIYLDNCDFFYLFSNEEAMDFYPKYGYKPVQESTFTFEANKFSSEQNQLQKLVISDPDTQTKIYDLAKTRKVLSKQFGVLNGHKLFMYHCLYPFRDCLYYLESENLLVICKKKGDELHIYDLIWQDNIDFKRIVRKITDERIRRILLHFTPDLLNVDTISELSTDNSSLFVRNISPKDVPDNILHPVTSEA